MKNDKKKQSLKSNIIRSASVMALAVTQLLLYRENAWPTEFIEDSNFDFMWVILLLVCFFDIVLAVTLHFMNRKRAAEGKEISGILCKYDKVQKIIAILLIAAAIIYVIVTFGVGREGNDTVKIEYDTIDGGHSTEWVENDDIPLTLEDLGVDTSEMISADKCCEKYTTVLGKVTGCSQNYYDKNGEMAAQLSYNVAEIRFDTVKEKLIREYETNTYYNDYLPFKKVSADELKLWDADEVYYAVSEDGYSARLVIYEDSVIFINNSEADYTERNIKIIKNKLSDMIN